MAALAPAFLRLYTTKDFFTISLVQVLAAWTSVAISNFASTPVSLLTRSAASLRLFCFVFAMLCFTLIRMKSRIKLSTVQVLKLILFVFGSAAIFHVIAILFGASVTEQTEETFCWALLMSHLVILPACSLLGAHLELFSRIFFSSWSDGTPESYFQCSIIFTLLGAWLGAFPIPLDWDRPWQVWPIPCVIGALIGYIVGLAISTLIFAFSAERLHP
ncbi:phosphatidylinositol-glycan biosynthesis class F protein-like [Stylophora pistillata]|uniref:Phosphatidylinositol-glycan biosynthesis class F protein n=1 Tax=Stylophora pistillata TaxID=50429 RepID=A0A2B4SPB6_STYPI|nr:phosphatidylinositol-glycan biosynthesis class F protein-like [Stylophora pistillata]PFX30720.1 Phosphatidylinositol-glycan biosynthesis class F protein [Stylophora pistillata]